MLIDNGIYNIPKQSLLKSCESSKKCIVMLGKFLKFCLLTSYLRSVSVWGYLIDEYSSPGLL